MSPFYEEGMNRKTIRSKNERPYLAIDNALMKNM